MTPPRRDEFYVGYHDRPPPALGGWLRRFIALGVIVGAFAAGFWMAAQRPFDPGTFEFGQPRHFQGVVVEHPYPSLLVKRPGISGRLPGFSRYWLVGAGKHGADDAVQGFDGKAVDLTGELIYRDGQTMIKLGDTPINALPADGADHFSVPALELTPRPLGPLEVTGEIVDPQCFLGIMKPGFGIPHRSCAIRCLAGGVPPVLRAVDARQQPHYYLLIGPNGRRINHELLPRVAETLRLSGQLYAYGDLLALAVDPASLSSP